MGKINFTSSLIKGSELYFATIIAYNSLVKGGDNMANLPWFAEKMSEYDPVYHKMLEQMASTALSPSALDKKTMLLILVALDALKGAGQGVKVLADQARQAGASEDEIKEALRLAYYVSGMDTVKASLQAFTEA
jgi:alkylhydroperoxidase/carboxymuconolactone decarboxylase family protein YurZ